MKKSRYFAIFFILALCSCLFLSGCEKHPSNNPSPIENNVQHHYKIVGSLADIGVAVIAPGSYGQEINGCERGISALAQRGFKVFNYYDHAKRYQRFAGTDENRLQQIKEAIDNPKVDVIMALRGGYGASRLMSSLDFKRIARSGKIFVGHSDLTAFQLALLKHGAISFSGPMVCSDYAQADLNAFTTEHFENALLNSHIQLDWQDKGNPDVQVSGTLWGGNLTMLASLVGTRYMPDIQGGILFVEDTNEHPYHLERMLIQLDEAGILRKQKALVLGRFTEYKITPFDNGYNLNSMVTWLRKRLPIPVITGLPFGHTKDKATLPIGGKAQLNSKDGNVSLKLSEYPFFPLKRK
jgi:muramoyltetrapeptide carboxypeptidase